MNKLAIIGCYGIVISASVLAGCRDTGISSHKLNKEPAMGKAAIYDFKVKGRGGAVLDLATLKGKVLLVVNTATGCGFTPQYEGLEKLYGMYHDKGLEILDFPCDQFGHQAPGSDDEIHQFCTLKYNTSFDQLAKIEVNGNGADPIFKFLKSARPKDDVSEAEIKKLRDLLAKYNLTGAQEPGDIEWNFTKFLIDRNGNVIKRFHPTTKPEAIDAEIVPLL
jgi:glutathione peroxidase